MSSLNRALAPLSQAAWNAIDEEAADVLKVTLAGRKLVDFKGPLGWETSAVDTGRVEETGCKPGANVSVRRRRVHPLVEFRREFEISRSEMEALDRGAGDPDLDPVVDAARSLAAAEDEAIFNGFADIGIDGILPSATHGALTISKNYENYPAIVAQAVSTLRQSGVGGPYAIALGPVCFTGLSETTVNGFPVLSHVAKLLDHAPVSAPTIDGALVMSMRGGDFELSVGRDFAIGYLGHDAENVSLYMGESLTFRVLGAEAAVPMVYRKK
tara:strand:+ start:2302 stop:3111 length:810 start_codon:yes stop_codon:yes gene_type:complete